MSEKRPIPFRLSYAIINGWVKLLPRKHQDDLREEWHSDVHHESSGWKAIRRSLALGKGIPELAFLYRADYFIKESRSPNPRAADLIVKLRSPKPTGVPLSEAVPDVGNLVLLGLATFLVFIAGSLVTHFIDSSLDLRPKQTILLHIVSFFIRLQIASELKSARISEPKTKRQLELSDQ